MWLTCSIIVFVLMLFFVRAMFKRGYFNRKLTNDLAGSFVWTIILTLLGPITLGAIILVSVGFVIFRLFALFMGAEKFWPDSFIELGEEWKESKKVKHAK